MTILNKYTTLVAMATLMAYDLCLSNKTPKKQERQRKTEMEIESDRKKINYWQ